MQDPLKQGLKPLDQTKKIKSKWIRMQDPLKQGLKLVIPSSTMSGENIRMQDPLKQGLKPGERPIRDEPKNSIRMQDPLKQGLKQFYKRFVILGIYEFECKIH